MRSYEPARKDILSPKCVYSLENISLLRFCSGNSARQGQITIYLERPSQIRSWSGQRSAARYGTIPDAVGRSLNCAKTFNRQAGSKFLERESSAACWS